MILIFFSPCRHELLKERLFTEHRNVRHLAEVLFNVFVSIETTGESVEFEQKLSYRQPMYKIIDYIWKIRLHREAIMVGDSLDWYFLALAFVSFKRLEICWCLIMVFSGFTTWLILLSWTLLHHCWYCRMLS